MVQQAVDALTEPLAHFTNLLEPLAERARRDPRKLALVFIQDDGARQLVSVAELHGDALAHAQALRTLDLQPRDIVVLVMGHSRALISTFLGALHLGAVPTIFPYLTEKLDPTVYAERVRAVVASSGARAVITGSSFHDQMETVLAGVECRLIDSAKLPLDTKAEPPPDRIAACGDDLAYLQYTSGTSGVQKGIPNSHRRVLQFIQARIELAPFLPDDVVVSWLPLYHDMGLVTGLLMPLVLGVPTVLMSPFRWVRDPGALLRAVHEFRGTRSWIPNSALNHCVQGVRERDLEGLDLSCWRSLFCGGEQVRHDSRQRFLERFAPYGVREAVLQVGYGMAENVCGAAITPPGQPARVDWIRAQEFERDQRAVPAVAGAAGVISIVSCGVPFPGTEIRVVSGDGRPLPERCIGEIILRNQHMFGGYHKRPDLTAQAIRNGWFHTGDLGYLADGELYVCGRKSDVIIVGGRNLYPDDLEALAGGVPGVVPGRAVAFGVPDERDGTERVVLMCEIKPELDPWQCEEIGRVLRRRAARELDIVLGEVRFVPMRWVLKTSNGKIAHAANREKYMREFRNRTP